MALKKLVIEDFTGGRNTLDSVDLIAPNQHSDGDNVWCETRALTKRRGCTIQDVDTGDGAMKPLTQMIATNFGSVLSLCLICDFGTRRNLLITTNGTNFTHMAYKVGTVSTAGSSTTITGSGTAWLTHAAIGDYFTTNLAGNLWNRITAVNSDTEIVVTSAVNLSAGTAYGITHSINASYTAPIRPVSMELFDLSGAQQLYVVDGERAFRSDGTHVYRADNQHSMPAFKKIVVFKNYIFGIGHNATDIRWCNLKDPTTWASNNFQTVTSVGDPTRGMKVYGDSIVIMTRYRMFRFLGDTFDPATPTYVLEQIAVPNDHTFTFQRTIVEHLGKLKFLTSSGWFEYDGGNSIRKISDPIQYDVDFFRKVPYEDEDIGNISTTSAFAYTWKNRMWCAVASTTTGIVDTIWVQDERGKWWRWTTGSAMSAITDMTLVKYGTSGSFILQACGSVRGLLTMDTGDSQIEGLVAAAIDGNYTSREFVFAEEADVIEAIVYMKKQSAGNLTVSVSLDRANFINYTCSMTAGVGTMIKKRIPIGRCGKAIRVKVGNATIAQTFEIYKIEIVYEPSEGVRI